MKKVLLICLYLCLSGIERAFGNPVGRNHTLELVQVIFRHGERTPNNCEANLLSNVDESSYAPWGFSRLTNRGMMEEYRIGEMLRNRYKGFIPEVYHPNDVYAFSSSYDRTKASLQLVLAALYPPAEDLLWNNDLEWMPIPTHAMPRKFDILNKPRDCPKYIEELDEFSNSTEFEESMMEHNEIMQTMRNIYGKDFDLSKLICAYNLISIQKALNLTLPDWYTDELFDKVSKAMKFSLDALSHTPTLNRLNGGPLVRRLVDNMKEENSSKKLYLYSSHDKNVYAYVKGHGLTLKEYPDFGTTIILEKFRDESKQPYVKLLLWTGKPKTLTTLKLNDCAEVCPLEEYLRIVGSVLPTDSEMRCLFQNLQAEDIERAFELDADGSD